MVIWGCFLLPFGLSIPSQVLESYGWKMNSTPCLGPLVAGPVAEAGRGGVLKGARCLRSAGSGTAPSEGGGEEVGAPGGRVGKVLVGSLSRLAATGWGRGGRGVLPLAPSLGSAHLREPRSDWKPDLRAAASALRASAPEVEERGGGGEGNG